MMRMKSRRGISLVEEIAAVLILAVVVFALLGTIGFAQRAVAAGNTREVASAAAQDLADTLLARLSASESDPDLSSVETDGVSAVRVPGTDAFSGSAANPHQFAYDRASGEVPGYNITVRVYYDGGKNHVEAYAFASDTKGELG